MTGSSQATLAQQRREAAEATPVYLPNGKGILAVGPSGSDLSTDNGATWTAIDSVSYDAFSLAGRTGTGWASGAQGHIGKYSSN